MDVFLVAVFLFLSGCHMLIEKSAIFKHKNAISISGRYYIAIFERTGKKKKKLLKTTKMLHYLQNVFCLPTQNKFFVGLF
jgi:thioredoxin-related protein